jgi:hypothetical protein
MSTILDRASYVVKRFRSGIRIDPVRDWFMVITAAAIALIAIIAWNIWTFDVVASGKSIGGPAPKAVPVFDPAALEAVKNTFEMRAQEEAKYLTGVYSFTDPSQ